MKPLKKMLHQHHWYSIYRMKVLNEKVAFYTLNLRLQATTASNKDIR